MTKSLAPVRSDNYSIEATEHRNRLTVVLTGTFDMSAVQDLQSFLSHVRQEVEATNPTHLDVNVSAVYFLGSSCIKAFVSLTAAMKVLPKRPKLTIVTSARLDWQGRTFAVLARLAPEIVTIERAP